MEDGVDVLWGLFAFPSPEKQIEQFEFYGKSFSLKITTCNQIDREMDGQLSAAKNLLFLTPLFVFGESSKSKPNFVASTWNINSNLSLEEDSMICKHVSTVKDVLFMSYVTELMWKAERERKVFRKSSEIRQKIVSILIGKERGTHCWPIIILK